MPATVSNLRQGLSEASLPWVHGSKKQPLRTPPGFLSWTVEGSQSGDLSGGETLTPGQRYPGQRGRKAKWAQAQKGV